jgi:hypothetical protein
MPENAIFSHRTSEAPRTLFDPANKLWEECEAVAIDRYWDGRSALRERGHNWMNLTCVRSLWSDQSLFFYFESWFDSLNVNPEWSVKTSTEGLWSRDVVEVFLKPSAAPSYFEIEVSPLGQWADMRIVKPRVEVDLEWNSDLELETLLNKDESIWRVFLGLPYESIREATPEVGTSWRANLYRITGKDPDREYLAWRPTFTGKPDFHVPPSFGHLIFV